MQEDFAWETRFVKKLGKRIGLDSVLVGCRLFAGL